MKPKDLAAKIIYIFALIYPLEVIANRSYGNGNESENSRAKEKERRRSYSTNGDGDNYGVCGPSHFQVHDDTIIRTQDSRQLGAKYINETELPSKEECLLWCCQVKGCNVAVFEEKDAGSCYLFDCGPSNNFKCKFTSHNRYTSAILDKSTMANKPQNENSNHDGHSPGWTPADEHITALKNLRNQASQSKAAEVLIPPTIPSRIGDFTVDHQSVGVNLVSTPTSVVAQEVVTLSPQIPPTKSVLMGESRCSHFQFQCRTSGECIAVYNACDGIPQCSDGSDESEDLGCPDGRRFSPAESTSSTSQSHQLQGNFAQQSLAASPSESNGNSKQRPFIESAPHSVPGSSATALRPQEISTTTSNRRPSVKVAETSDIRKADGGHHGHDRGHGVQVPSEQQQRPMDHFSQGPFKESQGTSFGGHSNYHPAPDPGDSNNGNREPEHAEANLNPLDRGSYNPAHHSLIGHQTESADEGAHYRALNRDPSLHFGSSYESNQDNMGPSEQQQQHDSLNYNLHGYNVGSHGADPSMASVQSPFQHRNHISLNDDNGGSGMLHPIAGSGLRQSVEEGGRHYYLSQSGPSTYENGHTSEDSEIPMNYGGNHYHSLSRNGGYMKDYQEGGTSYVPQDSSEYAPQNGYKDQSQYKPQGQGTIQDQSSLPKHYDLNNNWSPQHQNRPYDESYPESGAHYPDPNMEPGQQAPSTYLDANRHEIGSLRPQPGGMPSSTANQDNLSGRVGIPNSSGEDQSFKKEPIEQPPVNPAVQQTKPWPQSPAPNRGNPETAHGTKNTMRPEEPKQTYKDSQGKSEATSVDSGVYKDGTQKISNVPSEASHQKATTSGIPPKSGSPAQQTAKQALVTSGSQAGGHNSEKNSPELPPNKGPAKPQPHIDHVEVNLAEVEMDRAERSAESSGAVLALTLGLSVTGLLLVLVGCRLRMVRRRLRRGRSPYAHDADYLVNGMYL